MRTPGSSDELERRRHLAVQRVLEGYSIEEVADFLGVDRTTVSALGGRVPRTGTMPVWRLVLLRVGRPS